MNAARSRLTFTFASGLYDRVLPLYTGEVCPKGFDLKFIVNESPRNIFDRMRGNLEFDIAELSSAEFITELSKGDRRFVAIPVFLSRLFRHSFIFVSRKSRITQPKDLEHRRIGIPSYTMSAAVFIRGMLQHEYDVDLSTVHWLQGALMDGGSHGALPDLALSKAVSLEHNSTGRSLNDLLESGEIDAIISSDVPTALHDGTNVGRLFPNFREIEREYYRRTRIFPIMHVGVIRRDIHEKYPFVASDMYRAMCEAKDKALAANRKINTLRYMSPWLPAEIEEIDEVFGGDPWPYGIEANRPTLEALVSYLFEQGMIAHPMPLEEIFFSVLEPA